MKYFVYIFWLLIIILGISFASLNSGVITLNYYINTTTIHLPVLLLITLILGALLGTIAMLPVVLKAQQAKRQSRYKLKELEQEVKNLRSIPIKDSH